MAEPGAFGTLLRRLRIAAGLTQEELATAARLSVRSVSDLERGVNQTARKETARLLAQALRLSGPVREEFEAVARGRQPIAAEPAGAENGLHTLSSAGMACVARTLPRDISSFTGRDGVLAALTASASGGGVVVGIHAIGGMAGVGKTAFAVHAAHLLSGEFPDGQYFLPLHGHTAGKRPVEPAEALASLLLTAGMAATRIPSGLEDRAALWRDHLAGKRALLVLDDAVSSEQVRLLLPGGNGTLVLITSRRYLTALDDAQTICLDALSPGEAADLLIRLAARRGLRPQDAGVLELAQLCGYLPLAIGLIGRRLKHHPSWTITDMAAELVEARDRLALMQAENVSVSAAFNLSYEELPADERRLFRRLGLHPGPEIGIRAAAALDGEDIPATAQRLAAIYEHYLLSEPARGRYRLHDLIRDHARSLAYQHDSAADRTEATSRLFQYYSAATASDHATLEWLRAERGNLLACVDHATAAGELATVIALTAGIALLLQHDGPWTEAISRHDYAAQAARLTGDRSGEAVALLDLGRAWQSTGAYHEALSAYRIAFGLYRDLGDRKGIADALSGLGGVRVRTADYPGAAEALLESLGIFRELGDRDGQGRVLVELGLVSYHSDAAPDAAPMLAEALGIYRDLGDRRGEAAALNLLGMVLRKNGDYEPAVEAFSESLAIARDVGRPLGELNALNNLGVTERLLGRLAAAVKTLEEALAIAQEIGNRQGEANALCFLAAARRETDDYYGAREALNAALDKYLALGDQGGEAEAHNESATLYFVTGDLAWAEAEHQAALTIALQIGSSWDQAFALAGLGRCAIAAGRADEGNRSLKRARDLFERADPGYAMRIAAELAAS